MSALFFSATSLFVALIALGLERRFGYPPRLYRAIRHPVVWIGAAAVGLLGLAFTVAAVQARVGWRVLLALAVAPFYVGWKLIVQLKALLGLRGGLKEFGATERR